MLGVFLSPHYATDQTVYVTYIEPGDYGGGQALARGKLNLGRVPRLEDFEVIWRQMPKGKGGQAGGQIAFAPDGQSLFMSVGDRQRMTPAQDPNQAVGKILHLTLDGKPAADNPNFGKTGAASISLIDPPIDTEVAKTAKVVSTYTFPGPNQTPAETWVSGLRAPYGLAFSPAGELWEVEHGPRGGDELNLIEKGKNYGWPVVSYGMNYNQVPIPNPDTRSEFTKPVLYWVPVIAQQPDVLPRYPVLPATEWQRLRQRHGKYVAHAHPLRRKRGSENCRALGAWQTHSRCGGSPGWFPVAARRR
jgi:glucose/arabinose dehydrogenase